jgi:three-Cys-motif partner protein
LAVADFYEGREQTKAKHFILKRYLQALAFKVLNFSDLAYVDGFSGPWEERDSEFSDTSFKIAIEVLKDAQHVLKQKGISRRIRCFFSESNAKAFDRLKPVVEEHHDPANRFEVQTYGGRFEDAVSPIQKFVVGCFPLIFIDPTGWTGYAFHKIRPLFAADHCEVLVNFMYDYVNRFVSSEDAATVSSFDAILGGPGWVDRLDTTLPKGVAVERLFRAALQEAGDFKFVVSTKIDKPTQDRPHFFIAYGTKSQNGLKTFRNVEFDALKRHESDRLAAKERDHEARTGQGSLFSNMTDQVQGSSVHDLVLEQIVLAKTRLLELVADEPMRFSQLVPQLLQPFMIRETNVKDLCVELAKKRLVENTWSPANRKPNDAHLIGRFASSRPEKARPQTRSKRA